MADLNYINPMSIKPEIGWAPKNALAGMMYHQNEQDYRQMLGQQMRMQDLGEQERRYDFAEKQEGAPLRQMERQLKGETIQGQLPFARQAAGSQLQHGMAKNEFDMKTEFGPEALKAKVTKYLGEADDVKFKRFTQENQYAASLLEQAMSIEQARGPVAAIEYVDQRAKELEQQGFKFPEHFKNPMNWKPMYDAAVNSVKMAQEMKTIKAKGNEDVRGRAESGKYTIRAAEIAAEASKARAAAGGGRTPSMNNPVAYVNYLEQEMSKAREAGDTEALMKYAPQYEAGLGRAYDANIKKMLEMGVISNPMDEKVQAGRSKYITDGMRLQGFREKGAGSPDATPAPGQSLKNFTPPQGRKPLGSFD